MYICVHLNIQSYSNAAFLLHKHYKYDRYKQANMILTEIKTL